MINCVAKVRSHKALCGFANSACAKPGSHLRRTQVVPQLWQIWPSSGNFMTFLEILLISMPWDQRCVQLRCQGCQRIHPRTADATLRAFVQNHSIFICLRLLDECAQPFQSFIAYPQQPSSFVNDLYIYCMSHKSLCLEACPRCQREAWTYIPTEIQVCSWNCVSTMYRFQQLGHL